MSPEAAVAAALAPLQDRGIARLGIAVSGGGDSMALLALAGEWAAGAGVTVAAATVDHGLRPGSAAEAALAGSVAARLGLSHHILPWTGWDHHGNLQAAARAGRRALLATWAAGQGIGHVCLGHTMDDQAETVLLRLARGSGVDGLAGMAAARADPGGPVWLRPLLPVRRDALRAVLAARGLPWAEDPSNDDLRFDRVKARQVLASGALPGLDTETLAETAARMAAARQVLGRAALAAGETLAEVAHGAIAFEREGFAALPADTRWRLLAAALCRVAGQAYRPRLRALQAAEAAALAGGRLSLHGCLVWGDFTVDRRRIRVDREPAALADVTAAVPGIWDRRWQIEGPASAGETVGVTVGVTVGALGAAGLSQVPDWRAAGIPRAALLASPAVRDSGRLLAAPLIDGALRRASPWSARPLWSMLDFCADLASD